MYEYFYPESILNLKSNKTLSEIEALGEKIIFEDGNGNVYLLDPEEYKLMWEQDEQEHDMGEMYGLPHGASSDYALKFFESRRAKHHSRKISSSKVIKSGFGGTAVFEIIDEKLMEARRNIRSCISISTRKELDDELREIDVLIGDAMTHAEMIKNGDYDDYMVKSSIDDKSDYYQSKVNTEGQLKKLLDKGVKVEAKHTGPFGENKGASVIAYGKMGDLRDKITGAEYIMEEEGGYDNIEDWFADNEDTTIIVLDKIIGQSDVNWYTLDGYRVSDLDLWANIDNNNHMVKSSRKPIKSSIDDDNFSFYDAVAEALPMCSPAAQDEIADVAQNFFGDDEYDSQEDLSNLIYNYIDNMVDANELSDETVKDLLDAGYIDEYNIDDDVLARINKSEITNSRRTIKSSITQREN